MFIAEIHDWIRNNQRKYNIGVDLYNRYGQSSEFKKLFKNQNLYTENKLKEELIKLQGELPANPKTIEVTNQFKVYSDKKYNKISFDSLPDRLKELDIAKGRLFQLAQHSKYKMDSLPEKKEFNKERKKLAEAIEHAFDNIDAIWKELDYFNTNNKELPEAERLKIKQTEKKESHKLPETKYELLKKRTSIMSLRSRAKKEKNENNFKKYDKIVKAINLLLYE